MAMMPKGSHNPLTVAILGCGKMGTAMAERLLGQGHGVVLWNRTRERAAEAAQHCAMSVQRGGRLVVALTPRHAVEALTYGVPRTPPPEGQSLPPRLMLVTVSDGVAAQEVAKALELSRQGSVQPKGLLTVANLTSGSPDEGRAFAQWLTDDVNYVDGAYCGAPAAALSGKGQLFVSAKSEETITAVRPILASLGDVVFSGPIGASRALDYAVVDLAFVNLMSYLANAAMLEKEGVSVETFAREARKRLGVVPDAIVDAAKRIDHNVPYDESPVATLRTWRNFWASRLPYLQQSGLPSHAVADFAVSLLDRAGASHPDLQHSDITRLQEVLRLGKDVSPAASTPPDAAGEGEPVQKQIAAPGTPETETSSSS